MTESSKDVSITIFGVIHPVVEAQDKDVFFIYTTFAMSSCFQWEGLYAYYACIIRFESGATHGFWINWANITWQLLHLIPTNLKKSQSELATKNDIAPLASKTDLLELKVDIVKWVGALMLAKVAVIAALVKLLWKSS